MDARARHFIIPFLGLFGCLSFQPGWTQTITLKDTVYHLSEVLVESERLSEIEQIRNRPTFVTILPMEEASRRVQSTAEYLGQSVSLHVKSTGGYGAYSTASIRGSSAKQVTVFIDGVPLNQAHSGVVNLADLPVSSLSRIEVYRGFGAFDLSGSTIGGVVNLVTERPSDEDRGRLSFSYGSLSTQKYMGSYSFSRAGWDVLAMGSALSTDGNFEFLDDNGTPYNKSDDEIGERINNHLEAREAMVKASRRLGPGTLVVANHLYHRKQGLPGYGSVQSKTEALTKTQDLLHASWERPPSSSMPLHLDMGLFTSYESDHFEDRRENVPPAKPDVFNRALSVGGTLRWRVPVLRNHLLRGLAEVRRESFKSEEIFTESFKSPEQTRTSYVLTLESELNVWPGHLRVVPGGRYERHRDRTGALPAGSILSTTYLRGLGDTTVTHEHALASLSAMADLGAGVTLKANVGRYHRLPSLMELFGYQGIVLPNHSLRPETGLNRDIGVRWNRVFSSGRFVSFEYVYFWSDVEDLIVWYRSALGASALNLDRADIDGYEVSLSAGEWQGLSLCGNLTRLDAVNKGPVSYSQGKTLPDRPEYAAFGKITWRRGPASVFYEFDYVDGNYWNSYNGAAPNNEGPSRVRRLHNVGITIPTGLPHVELTGEVKNATDEQIEDVMGYPVPGRSVYGTISIEH